MRRTNTNSGAKFTVRGQVYIQTGAFFHTMGNNREGRVLELDTACPECSQTFQVTASMRQISTRQLVRRCRECRKTHTGPVVVPAEKPNRRASRSKPQRPAAPLSAASNGPVASCSERLTALD